jgi:hypothetical protein
MRKLHKIIATAAGTVTAGALAPSLVPSAAAAGSASDCYAQLNAVRAAVGSPAASATALPALEQAAAAHAAYRAEASADGHTDQSPHHETPGRDGVAGAASWDRTKAAGLQDGTWSGQFENVTTTGGASAASGTVDANLPGNAAMLAATKALDAHTTYHVRVSGSVKVEGGSWKPFAKAWSFTTA